MLPLFGIVMICEKTSSNGIVVLFNIRVLIYLVICDGAGCKWSEFVGLVFEVIVVGEIFFFLLGERLG